ncbi:hypothetical protein P22_2390 [Propionispora sp. 2/2-37]|uniref:menaquinone biosynthetic enzyme MqnA/MqnD family protein n=1 Tax=Propionispora sp. 2/2-37 TaxID=1677858 RepID=UPI0006BB6AF9|nr:menaquinone biosynthesis protein [Propionispora sp. 2/2-37]CUH96300.1 hypothetical protein P22_2390 [Propionispora sp. 2/2-37]
MIQPKLGHINFINCLPLDYGFKQGGFNEGLYIYPEVPSRLNQALLQGELDVSPVSSIIYALHADELLILPDVSISAAAGLQSILLVSKRPIAELNGAKIALTAKSATSHALLKIVLQQAYQVQADYFISGLSLAEGVLETADAVLFIGDDALHAYLHQQEPYYHYDMGEEWRKLTGLSMVYAVWAVNRSFAEQQADLLQRIYLQVTGGFSYGLVRIEKAAAVAEHTSPFDARQIVTYLSLLNYQFTEAHKKALLTFYRRAYELAIIPRMPVLDFAEVGHE